MTPFPLADVRRFFRQLTIPSRDEGPIRLTALYGTQEYLLEEIARGWEDGIHDFVTLKGGRQIGGTTIADGLDLYWPQTHPGLVGMMVADDDDNMRYRRDVITQMLAALAMEYRWPVRQSNPGHLAWEAPNRSRLIFAAAGKRTGSNLGRSKGLNYLHGDEVGSWVDQKAISALRASLSKRYAHRLYLWISTARGFNSFHEMWTTAQRAVAQRAIFVGWWRHAGYRIAPSQTALWETYAAAPFTADEQLWMREVERRYGVIIEPGQVAWYRWQLTEEFFGDETLLSQEYGILPEDCFVSFGSKFIAIGTVRRLRAGLEHVPAPDTFRYVWAQRLDDVRTERVAPHPKEPRLTVWETPDPLGAYLIGARSAGSTTPNCPDSVATVWRLFPDRMIQVAEYQSEEDATYQFAWAVLHLIAAYGTRLRPAHLALDIQATGQAVFDEIMRVQSTGWGLSARPPVRGEEIIDFQAPIRHYLHRRLDSLTGRALLQWKTSPSDRPLMMHGLRDQIERGTVVPRSAPLIDELAMLRRGEGDAGDQIGAEGVSRDGRAIAMGLAVRHYLTVVDEIARWVAPVEKHDAPPVSVAQVLTQHFLHRIVTQGRW